MSVLGNKSIQSTQQREKSMHEHKTKRHLQCINKNNGCIVTDFWRALDKIDPTVWLNLVLWHSKPAHLNTEPVVLMGV